MIRRLAALGIGRPARGPLIPESLWVVSTAGERIDVTDADGATRGIAKADLGNIAIETNDSGPWGADFWWLFFGQDREIACAFPQGATGEAEAMDWMLALPDFDHEAMIRANCSTDNATFEVWRAPALAAS